MQVVVRLFAAARDAAGWERRVLELPEGATLADIPSRLVELTQGGASTALLESSAFAVNQQYARRDTALRDGDEIAVLPPVSGG